MNNIIMFDFKILIPYIMLLSINKVMLLAQLQKQKQLFCFASNAAPQFDYLYGINPIMAALNADRRQIHELFVNQSQQNDHLNPRVANIINRANQLKLPIKMISRNKLEKFCGPSQPHQNVVLKCSKLNYQPITALKENQSCVVLDQIQDPQNLGAILRVAFYFGVDQIIVESRGTCPLSATVSKTSAGALELIDVFQVPDLTRFVREGKPKFKVYGTGFERSVPFDCAPRNQEAKLIVLGAEANGVRYDILRLCDQVLNIPAKRVEFPGSLVDSLNVSVSAGVVLQHLLG